MSWRDNGIGCVSSKALNIFYCFVFKMKDPLDSASLSADISGPSATDSCLPSLQKTGSGIIFLISF